MSSSGDPFGLPVPIGSHGRISKNDLLITMDKDCKHVLQEDYCAAFSVFPVYSACRTNKNEKTARVRLRGYRVLGRVS